jgi:hypothetical protein
MEELERTLEIPRVTREKAEHEDRKEMVRAMRRLIGGEPGSGMWRER